MGTLSLDCQIISAKHELLNTKLEKLSKYSKANAVRSHEAKIEFQELMDIIPDFMRECQEKARSGQELKSLFKRISKLDDEFRINEDILQNISEILNKNFPHSPVSSKEQMPSSSLLWLYESVINLASKAYNFIVDGNHIWKTIKYRLAVKAIVD